MENKEMKNTIPAELVDDILKKVSAGLTEEEILSIFESEEARRSELQDLRNENLRSQMDAAHEAYEAHRNVAEKDFVSRF